jgi:cell division protein FtsW
MNKHQRLLLSITIGLITLGFIFIYSSSFFYAEHHFHNGCYYIYKQGCALFIGIIAATILYQMESKTLYNFSAFFFIISLLLTILPLIPKIGISLNGAKRWINMGFFLFQPSELLKCATVLYGARFLSNVEKKINTYTYFFLLVFSIPLLILLLQPDFGQAVVLAMTLFSLLFLAGGNIWTLVKIFFLFICSGTLLVIFKSYRLKRLLTFLDPFKDPMGSGFQIIQSLIAIHNGKWFGLGIAQSKQKFFYLPMQHTDFIFSIICEEIGFIGAFLITSLYMAQFYVAYIMSSLQKNLFNKLVILGSSLLITFQAFLNFFVTTASLPTKGIVLPFLSYGSSSLISMCIFISFILICSKNESFQR